MVDEATDEILAEGNSLPVHLDLDELPDDGLPFDPWLRVHARAGARILKVCPESMIISGSVADWEAWTGMTFPESGRYVVPDALQPVEIDVEADREVYVEPNVWVHHAIA